MSEHSSESSHCIDGVFAGYIIFIRAGSDVLLFNFMKGWK